MELPQRSPRRQDSSISTTSSGGQTVRANSLSRKSNHSNESHGFFARFRARNGAKNNDEDGSDSGSITSEAGPSDWYRRSPSPNGYLNPDWRQASPDANGTNHDVDEGPSDTWTPDSPASYAVDAEVDDVDEKIYEQRLGNVPHQKEEAESVHTSEGRERHPADVSVEIEGNGAPDSFTEDDSSPSSQMLSPSASSISLFDRPRIPTLPAISRLRSHHRSISTVTQQSFRPHHSRAASQFSQLSQGSHPSPLSSIPGQTDPAFNFYPLRQLSASLYKSQTPSAMDVRGMMAIGTQSGQVLVYDFAQKLKHTLVTDITMKSGPVTAVKISADLTYIAAGHASGNIHLWDLSSTTKPARTAPALTETQLKSRRKDGHLQGDAIRYLGFVAARHTAIVSGDEGGRVFWWSLGKVMGVESNDVMRILGGSRRGKLFAALPLPMGDFKHPTDEIHISALLTPRKLVIVGMKPSAKTLHRRLGAGKMGCAAWLRAGELGEGSDPVLAYSWDRNLHFLRAPAFVEPQSYAAPSDILEIQWFDKDHLLLRMETSISLFNVVNHSIVETSPFQSNLVLSSSVYKSKLFILTRSSVQAGTLLQWNDKLLSLVHRGDFLSAIQLAVAYYTGQIKSNTINLPDRPTIGARIRELVSASLQWAFSDERMRDDTHYSADGRGVDLTTLFEGLATSCIESFLAVEDVQLLEESFEYFERSGIQGIFLRRLEPFIADHPNLPPTIVKALITLHEEAGEYDLTEEIIWSVDPTHLDINQAVTLCEKHKLWDALIHVYNRAMFDYVSPVVKLLGPEVDSTLVYAYLEFVLSGLSYPSGRPLPNATEAQSAIYDLIFGGYLDHLLAHTEAFLHALDIAFEHSYLNDSRDISRQVIINTLLDAAFKDVFVQIFVARNLPKYPQFIILQPSTLHRLLVALSTSTDPDTLEDRQMAVEYLLSAYTPRDLDHVLLLFEEAKFYRLLARYYRRDKKWKALARIVIQDKEADVFEELNDVLLQDPAGVEWKSALPRLLALGIDQTAQLVDRWQPQLHNDIISNLPDIQQLYYLRALLEPDNSTLSLDLRHQYIDLLRKLEPTHVFEYLQNATGLDYARLANESEKDGFSEAQIWAMEKDGNPETFSAASQIIRQLGIEASKLPSDSAYHQLEAMTRMAVQLAHKHSSEEVWMQIFSGIIDAVQVVTSPQALRGIIQETLSTLISSNVSFPSLFKRLVEETSTSQTAYTEFRTILTGMLESYRAEGEMLLMSTRLIHADVFVSLKELASKRQAGWRVQESLCTCGEKVSNRGLLLGSSGLAHIRCGVSQSPL